MIEVSCGSGVYIRSLIHDIGQKLNTVATCMELVREQQGEFSIHDTNTLTMDKWSWENIEKLLSDDQHDNSTNKN